VSLVHCLPECGETEAVPLRHCVRRERKGNGEEGGEERERKVKGKKTFVSLLLEPAASRSKIWLTLLCIEQLSRCTGSCSQ
jgi:hypothetical protein